LTRKLYDMVKAGEVVEARRVQTQVTTLFDAATGSVPRGSDVWPKSRLER